MATLKEFAVSVHSKSNGSVHSANINLRTYIVEVGAGEWERGDAFREAFALYAVAFPDAILPSIAACEQLST